MPRPPVASPFEAVAVAAALRKDEAVVAPRERNAPAARAPPPAREAAPRASADDLALGTWTQRVTTFLGGGKGGSDAGDADADRAPARPAPPPDTDADGADDDRAWRWRFTRRWRLEQVAAAGGAGGGGAAGARGSASASWDEAEAYLAACGLAPLPSASAGDGGGLASAAASLGGGGLSMGFSSRDLAAAAAAADAAAPRPEATRGLAHVARRAAELVAAHARIDGELSRGGGRPAEGPGVAGPPSPRAPRRPSPGVPRAVIDWDGGMPFILARTAAGSGGRGDLVVRARAGASIASLLRSLQAEADAAAAAAAADEPTAYPGAPRGGRVALVGSGALEWARGRERAARVSACAVGPAGAAAGCPSTAAVAQAAAAVLRGALPLTHTVTAVV